MLIFDDKGLQGDVLFEIARLKALVTDLQRLCEVPGPSAADLAEAPLLSPFGIGIRKRPCLIGYASGHPLLGSQDVQTSELWAMSADMSWGRTLTRYYRLGEKLKEQPCEN